MKNIERSLIEIIDHTLLKQSNNLNLGGSEWIDQAKQFNEYEGYLNNGLIAASTSEQSYRDYFSTRMEKKNKDESKSKKDEKYKKPKPKVSGKEGSKERPSWAEGKRPYKGESGKDFAKRLMDEKYGKGNYDPRKSPEYSKLKKYGNRSFEN